MYISYASLNLTLQCENKGKGPDLAPPREKVAIDSASLTRVLSSIFTFVKRAHNFCKQRKVVVCVFVYLNFFLYMYKEILKRCTRN